jgi:hypothetical protein
LSPARKRVIAFVGLIAAALLGLASRKTLLHEVPILGEYGGDVCWAIAAFALVRLCVPRVSVRVVMLVAGALSLGVELSQLIDIPVVNDLRENALVALLIGRGFLASDLASYAAGIIIAATVERLMCRAVPATSASARDQ